MFLLDLDPNVVKPGWTPLIITILLAAALVLLYLSMRRQFRRINVNPIDTADDLPEVDGDAADESAGPADEDPETSADDVVEPHAGVGPEHVEVDQSIGSDAPPSR